MDKFKAETLIDKRVGFRVAIFLHESTADVSDLGRL